MPAQTKPAASDRSDRALSHILQISLVIFCGRAAIGLVLPDVPLHIQNQLGFDVSVIGWVMAAQSLATLLARPWAGGIADQRGGKQAVVAGLGLLVGASALCWMAALSGWPRDLALGLFCLSRICSGLGDGLVVTGGAMWALGLMGMARAGRAMSSVGLAMFGGTAAGATLGALVDIQRAASLACLTGGIGIAIALTLPTSHRQRLPSSLPLRGILRAIALPGTTAGLSAVGVAVVTAFAVLAFQARGWSTDVSAIACFGAGHVAARVVFGGFADRINGPAAAIATLLCEGIGLGVLWLAPTATIALAGATMAGFGFSMVYPLMALPALRQVPGASRGLAIGLYDACFDVAMGLSALVGGLIADAFGLPMVFLVASIAALAAIGCAIPAFRPSPPRVTAP